jgi:hypothetical protein
MWCNNRCGLESGRSVDVREIDEKPKRKQDGRKNSHEHGGDDVSISHKRLQVRVSENPLQTQ